MYNIKYKVFKHLSPNLSITDLYSTITQSAVNCHCHSTWKKHLQSALDCLVFHLCKLVVQVWECTVFAPVQYC